MMKKLFYNRWFPFHSMDILQKDFYIATCVEPQKRVLQIFASEAYYSCILYIGSY